MIQIYDQIHEWLMQNGVVPMFYYFGRMDFIEESSRALDWFLLGCIQIVLIRFLFRPFEGEPKFESLKNDDRMASIRSDIYYCFFHRLGCFQLIFFFVFNPFFLFLEAVLHDFRFEPLNLEQVFPVMAGQPFLIFLTYLIVLDFIDYLYHRLSHRIHWWWKLHALHHSQKYLTVWSDNRNHLVDDILRSLVFATVALIIGIEPSQFILLHALNRLLQSWQHGSYAREFKWLKYIIVTPKFHRYHHAIRLGYELPGKPGVLGGCNFGVLFPWWDMIFSTAVFEERFFPTGVESIDPVSNPIMQQVQFAKLSWLEIKKLFNIQGM